MTTATMTAADAVQELLSRKAIEKIEGRAKELSLPLAVHEISDGWNWLEPPAPVKALLLAHRSVALVGPLVACVPNGICIADTHNGFRYPAPGIRVHKPKPYPIDKGDTDQVAMLFYNPALGLSPRNLLDIANFLFS